ncbi:MAG: hypothetical protein IJ737_07150 [Ruminococcus sp.]|nr:hypothetical protein [Ruminococcus sp.]
MDNEKRKRRSSLGLELDMEALSRELTQSLEKISLIGTAADSSGETSADNAQEGAAESSLQANGAEAVTAADKKPARPEIKYTPGTRPLRTDAARKENAAALRAELKDYTPAPEYVPTDFKPQKEGSAQHDAIVDKLRADRKRLSRSVWTDQPVLKPRKSIWLDEATLQLEQAKIEAAREAKRAAKDPPKPPVPQEPQLRPILSEKPDKQEFVMSFDGSGSSRVKEVRRPSGRTQLEVTIPDRSARREISLAMPVYKMIKDEPEVKEEPKPAAETENTEVKTETAQAAETSVPAVPAANTAAENIAAQSPAVKPAEPEISAPAEDKQEVKAETAAPKAEEAEKPAEEKKPAAAAAVTGVATGAAAGASAVRRKGTGAGAAASLGAAANLGAAGTARHAVRMTADGRPIRRRRKKPSVRTQAIDLKLIDTDREPEKADSDLEKLISERTEEIRAKRAAESGKLRSTTKISEKSTQPHIISETVIGKDQTADDEPIVFRKHKRKPKPKYHELEFNFINCLACIGVMYAVFFALFIMKRESGFVDSENRNLAEFPDFSISSYFSGDYTKGVDRWFTDTFPGREELKKMGADFKLLFGIQLDDIVVKGNLKTVEKETLDTDKVATTTTVTANTEITSSKQTTSFTTREKTSETVKDIEPVDEVMIENGIIVVGSGPEVRAMEQFYGTFAMGAYYAETINKWKDEMPDVNVYNMTIPLASAFYLPESFKDTGTDQRDNIENIGSELRGVINVNVFDILDEHKDEYIYSRTDHHWQPLGAYYAASVFAKKAGVPFPSIDTYDEWKIEDFVGTMYAFSDYVQALADNPDTLVYHKPDNYYVTTYYNTDFSYPQQGDLFFDFASGINSYSVILGRDDLIAGIETDCTNGRTLVIVKNSFGNALVPYLTHSFTNIYVIDYRYFDLNGIEFCRSVNCTDLLFAVSISGAANQDHVDTINNIRIQDSPEWFTDQFFPEKSSSNTQPSDTQPYEPEETSDSEASSAAEDEFEW